MGQMRSASKRDCTACALAPAAAILLALCAGCGVRADQRLSQAPLPICGDGSSQICQTAERGEAFEAPSWLVRCRRGWLQWRNGRGITEEREAILIPPPPRFHPVPTRPVFSPLEYEAPADARLSPLPQLPAPAAPVPKPTTTPEEISNPPETQRAPGQPPAERSEPKQQSASTVPSGNESAPGQQSAALAPKLLPRVLMPKTSPKLNAATGVPSVARSNPLTAKIPDSPQATEPLEESTPQWKPRR